MRTERDRASWGSGGNATVIVLSMAPACWRTNASSRSAVDYVVRKTPQIATIPAMCSSPHSLCHTDAIRTLRIEGNAVKVAKLLGHVSGTTTGRYLDHLALGELRSTVPTLPGAE